MFKRLLILLLLLMAAGFAAARAETAMTVMVYLCGSNLETDAGAASADLAEMMAHIPADGSVRVIVMPSGSRRWQSDVSPRETAIYELTGGGLEKQSALPLQSMGDPAALTALLDYGYAHAPARQYALVLWDHGAGPAIGLCFDELFPEDGGMDGLTLPELSRALENSPAAQTPLSWIGFDACLMATVETACAVAPYAEYMIASQEMEPASGWNYSFLAGLAEDASGAETGRRVIDAYFASQADAMAPVTLSCVDLRGMEEIRQTMDRLFEGLHLILDEQTYPDFAECRINTKGLGMSAAYEYDLIDLVDLLQVYQDSGMTDCSELLSLLDDAIAASRSNTPYIHGLSIHYPHYSAGTEVALAACAGYADFISDMTAIRLGETLTDWHETALPEAALAEGITHVTMALTKPQATALDSTVLFILRQMQGDEYQLVYRTEEVSLTDDNMLEAFYQGQALFIVDGEGSRVSEAIPYTLQEDAVVLNAMLSRGGEALYAEEDWWMFVRCIFRRDGQGRYRLSEVQENTGDPTRQGKSAVRLEDYDTISIFQNSVVPVYAADGSLLPPSQWETGALTYGWYFDLADFPGWSIDFLPEQDGRNRFALLQITDFQNQQVCSDLLPIANPNITELPVTEQTLLDNEYGSIRFTGAQEVQGLYPALRLFFHCENRSGQQINVDVRCLQLNDVILSRYSGSSPAINPGESKVLEIEVGQETLQRLGIQAVDTMQMTLVLNHDYTQPILEQLAACQFSADLSGVVPEPAMEETLTTAAWDGLELSLCSLSLEADGLTGTMRIRNTSGQPVTVDAAGFCLNNLQVPGYLTDLLYPLTLPPGAVYHTGMKIDLQGYPNDQHRPASSHFLLEAAGVTQLHTLGMSVTHGDWKNQTRLSFTLPEPLALPVEEAGSRLDAWPVLYHQDGLTLRLADITWEPDSPYFAEYRYINILADNATDASISLHIPWREQEDSVFDFRVNGQSMDYGGMYTLPAQTLAMTNMFYTVIPGCEQMESIDMYLYITDDGGREDLIHLVLEKQGDSRADGNFRVLPAEQLRVTVTKVR